jgi:stage IV sporulation protein FB
MLDFFAWKFPVGRAFGITIKVHILFVLVALPLTLRFILDKDAVPGRWSDVLTVAAIAIVSILLHEFGHCFAARLVGGEADEIMLWPLGGTAQVGYLPSTPWAHFWTSFGGPIVNLALCAVSALALAVCFDQSIRPVFNFFGWYPFRRTPEAIYELTLWNGEAVTTTSPAVMFATWVFFVNWFLAVFNLVLVGIPYDGGNMARAVLWPYVGHHQATMYMITTGFIIAGLMLMAVFFFDQTMLAFLCVYTFFSCRNELIMLETRGEDSLFGYDFSAGYTSLEKDMPSGAPPRKKGNFIQRYLQRRNARKLQKQHETQLAEEQRMDELLEKIQQRGKDSLTDEEQRFLKRVSDRYRNRH